MFIMFAISRAKLNFTLFEGSLVCDKEAIRETLLVGICELRSINLCEERFLRNLCHISCTFIRAHFYGPCAPYEDNCRHVFVDGEGYEGPRRRNTLYDSRGVKWGPGALHIKERISLLINILFLRWKFQVAVIRKKENTQSRNSLRFLWRRICSRVVNLSFMGRARGPRSFCFPNGLNYKHTYFL